MKKVTVLLIGVLLLSWSASSFAQKVQITFKVNMKVATSKGTFDPAKDVVSIPGGFNNWLNEPPANSTKTMTADANKEWYSKTYELETGKEYEFKFNIGTGWDGKDEPNNRKYTAPAANATVEYWFKDEKATGVDAKVKFVADMRLPMKQNDNFATTRKVYVAGDFTDWGTGAIEMKDPENDSTYTIEATIKSGTKINYKFIHSLGAASAGAWEDGDNRTYTVLDGNQTVTRFFNDANPNITLRDGVVSFFVNMSVLEQLGVYNPAKDALSLRAGFNGWSDSDKSKSVMIQDFLDPNNWFLSVPFVKGEVNSTSQFKFYVVLKDTSGWADGYERPLSKGGSNREMIFKGLPNQSEASVYYDDVRPAYVIGKGNSKTIKFRVNMADAFKPDFTNGSPMVKGDKVYWICENKLFIKTQKWADLDANPARKGIEMLDPDGDMIYEGTLTIVGPSFNGLEYRYGFQRASDKSWKQEEAGLGGKFMYRVRYIPQSSGGVFTQPYTAPDDKWLNQTDKSSQFETGPKGLSGVKELDNLMPTEYTLDQNYPNPFNPTTQIRISIPTEGMVSLKVYNVLGQEVAVLLNQNMKTGAYEIDFNGTALTSGIYFYRLEAGKVNMTKKMMLIK